MMFFKLSWVMLILISANAIEVPVEDNLSKCMKIIDKAISSSSKLNPKSAHAKQGIRTSDIQPLINRHIVKMASELRTMRDLTQLFDGSDAMPFFDVALYDIKYMEDRMTINAVVRSVLGPLAAIPGLRQGLVESTVASMGLMGSVLSEGANLIGGTVIAKPLTKKIGAKIGAVDLPPEEMERLEVIMAELGLKNNIFKFRIDWKSLQENFRSMKNGVINEVNDGSIILSYLPIIGSTTYALIEAMQKAKYIQLTYEDLAKVKSHLMTKQVELQAEFKKISDMMNRYNKLMVLGNNLNNIKFQRIFSHKLLKYDAGEICKLAIVEAGHNDLAELQASKIFMDNLLNEVRGLYSPVRNFHFVKDTYKALSDFKDDIVEFWDDQNLRID